MLERIGRMSPVAGYLPLGNCYFWNSHLIAAQASSNFIIGFANMAIAGTLIYLVYRIADLPFRRIYVAFGVFMLAVGITHFIDIWTVWSPHYLLGAGFRIFAALAAVVVALGLPAIVPKILALESGARAAREHGIKLENAYEELGTVFERTKEIDRLKTEFFANVSHELRTPLTLILGPAQALAKEKDRPQAERLQLELIEKNARLLLKHVNDLLDISKLDAGKMLPRFEKSNLAHVIRLAASNFEAAALERAIKMRVESSEALKAEIDVGMVERIMVNLIGNAFKFTPDKGVIRISCRQEKDFAIIEVADSGPGVSPELRRTIFERFNQAGPILGRPVSGTGLGLSIVKDLIDLHRGRIEVLEAPESGALFRIGLPLKQKVSAEWEEADPLPARGDRDLAEWSRQIQILDSEFRSSADTVLLVEDNFDLNQFIVSSLSPQYNVVSCLNGSQAIEKLRDISPDLILTDVMMPGMSGDQLVRTIRQKVEWDHIPIIVLTAKADDRFRVGILRDGAQDFILKPFSTDELLARAANLIAMKKAREMLQRELRSQVNDLEGLANEVSLQRRELQDALEKMRSARDEATRAAHAKDNFLGLVSHEVRTPLTAMQMQLEMFQRSFGKELDERQRKMLARVFESSARSLEIMDNLLEYTRLQSGNLTPSREDFELEPVTEQSVKAFAPEAEKKGIRLEFVRPAQKLPQVCSDVNLVKMVLQNLIGNAVKYTDEGEVRVMLEKNHGKLRVTVDDTGPGISTEMRERIFEPFEQVTPLERKHKPGFGLGLSIAKQAAAAVGGMILLRSRPGRGSRFTFEIPAS